jgi:hypothetical protein
MIGGKNQELSVTNLKEASQFYSTKMTALKLKRIERQKNITDLQEQRQNIASQISAVSVKKGISGRGSADYGRREIRSFSEYRIILPGGQCRLVPELRCPGREH